MIKIPSWHIPVLIITIIIHYVWYKYNKNQLDRIPEHVKDKFELERRIMDRHRFVVYLILAMFMIVINISKLIS